MGSELPPLSRRSSGPRSCGGKPDHEYRVPVTEAGDRAIDRWRSARRMGGQEIPDSFQLPPDTRWEVCEASPAERDMGVDSSNILFRATGPAVAEPARQ